MKNAFYVGHGSGGAWKVSAGTQAQLAEGVWQHFVVVRNSDTFTMYLDGNVAASGKGGGRDPVDEASTNLEIGEWGGGAGRPFNGMMDEVLIAGRVLSRDEIRLLGKGFERALSVDPKGKLATSWGSLKAD